MLYLWGLTICDVSIVFMVSTQNHQQEKADQPKPGRIYIRYTIACYMITGIGGCRNSESRIQYRQERGSIVGMVLCAITFILISMYTGIFVTRRKANKSQHKGAGRSVARV